MADKDRLAIWTVLVLLVSVTWAGCAGAPDVGGREAAALPASQPASSAVDCLVAYSARAGTGIDWEETVTLSAEAREQTFDLGDLVFHARYWPLGESPGEHTFRVWVTAGDTAAEIVSQLYQLSSTEAVRNQFVGDHGFTGLSYVYHPVSKAELQFTCKAR
jgi:hypothetical protein